MIQQILDSSTVTFGLTLQSCIAVVAGYQPIVVSNISNPPSLTIAQFCLIGYNHLIPTVTESTNDRRQIPMQSTIKLDQFLKKVGAVMSGGEAKMLIQGGAVSVNDEVETRRGRQLHEGDRVVIEGEAFIVEGLRE